MAAHIIRLALLAPAALALALMTCTGAEQSAGVDQGEAVDQREVAAGQAASASTDAVPDTEATPEASPAPGASVSLTEGIPPCTPVEGSSLDPCAPKIGPLIDNPSGHTVIIPGSSPRTMRRYLEGGSTNSANHIVVRATYLPKTVRCVIRDEIRSAGYVGLGVWDWENVQCFIDIRVNNYILGTGPNELSVVLTNYLALEGDDLEARRGSMERAYNRGGRGSEFTEVVGGGLPGREAILFIGPASNYAVEAWQVYRTWDVQRKDGQVRAIHPQWAHWNRHGTDEQKAKTELTLSAFATAVIAANTERKTAYIGRVRPEIDAPMIIPSAYASDLHQHHIDVWNTDHPDGPPSQDLPPPCGLAVPSQTTNPGLMLDCFALLAARDALRGTGTLNWSVDVAIAEWDGVTVAGTPQRVAKLELAGRGLTGCVPPALRDAAENDLDTLGLPDCVE